MTTELIKAAQQATPEPVGEPFGWVCRYLCHADDDGEQRWTDWHFTLSSESVPPKWSRGSYAEQEAVPVFTRPAPGVPDGFALVPVEPTWEMQIAASTAYREARDGHYTARMEQAADCWRIMLAAAQAKGGQ